MRDHVYKIVELVGSSRATIEDAVKNALSKSSESIRNSRWFEVSQIRGEIEGSEVSYWQVTLKLGFTVEGNSRKEEVSVETSKKEAKTGRYRCKVCGYIYDPEKGDPDSGIKPGTLFEDLPDDWKCPECGVNKDQFEEVGGE